MCVCVCVCVCECKIAIKVFRFYSVIHIHVIVLSFIISELMDAITFTLFWYLSTVRIHLFEGLSKTLLNVTKL